MRKRLSICVRGGIYDHIGFGFHRYSTDRKWLVPHFEKMLYDQAQLIIVYLEVYQITRKNLYKKTAEEILMYVMREMTSREGAFFSAEDADSEGEEGKFYLWEKAEIDNVLTKEEAKLFNKIYSIEEKGNWIEPMSGALNGTNIPHLQKSVKELALEKNIAEEELYKQLELIREKLFIEREKRIHPYKDDKVLTDWNALMISALAKAAQILKNKNYLEAAERAVDFINNRMIINKRLLHRFREGEAGLPAHIDDYAFLISALIDLYETSFNLKYLKQAFRLNDELLKRFWDNEKGGYFFTAEDGEELPVRQKEVYDGAVPSGNSVALLNILRLARISANTELEEKAEKMMKAFSDQIKNSPSAYTQFLIGAYFGLGETSEIIISGNKKNTETEEVISYIHANFLPNKIVLLNDDENKEDISIIAPYTAEQKSINGRTTVYICKNYVCNMPVTSLNELENLLKNK